MSKIRNKYKIKNFVLLCAVFIVLGLFSFIFKKTGIANSSHFVKIASADIPSSGGSCSSCNSCGGWGSCGGGGGAGCGGSAGGCGGAGCGGGCGGCGCGGCGGGCG
ncbi:MAG: hypothetical protein V1804_02945 [Patescibacteria group bacterium]